MRNNSYIQLSSFYFFFFAALGAFVPYWASYLKSLGFSSAEIGELIAIVMASKVIAPYFLSWLSDYLGKRLVIIQLSMIASAVIFAGVLPFQSYWWFVSVLALFGFFWNASLPLFEALTFNHLANDTDRYSQVRLWGSVGFILVVVLLPMFIQGEDVSRLPYIVLALLVANMATTFLIEDKPAVLSHAQPAKLIETLKTPIVIVLLITCAIQTMSHGSYYTFFTIYLEDHGYSREFAGWMWALGVLAEVVLFVFIKPLFKRFSICRLFVLSLFITSIRWVLLALWVDNEGIVLLAQLMHAASFGLFHVTAIALTHSLFPGRLQSRGQALYAGMSFGVGGSIGHLLSGYTWDHQGATWTILSSAVIALIGAIIAAKYITEEHLPAYVSKT